MASYDWATADYLTDALDSAERRAYAAEAALAEGGFEVDSTATRAIKAIFGKALIIGAAGGTAYAAHTIFEKDGRPHMPEILGVGADVVGGFALGLASFFGLGNRMGLGASSDMVLSKLSDGLFAHWGVVAGQRAGASALAASAGTAGVSGCADAEVGAPPSSPAMGQGSPTDYMTAAQKAAWERYANAA